MPEINEDWVKGQALMPNRIDTVATEQPSAQISVDMLLKWSETLHDALCELEARLSPLLLSTEPTSDEAVKMASPPLRRSQLVERLEEVETRIRYSVTKIHRIKEGVQI